MKKTCLFVLLIGLLLLNIFSAAIVHAQDEPPLPGEVKAIQNFSETAGKLTDKEKREYLFKELQDNLLKNKAVSVLDSFFTKISPVFIALFGEPYTLSGILLVIVILWFYFFFKFSEIFTNYSAFSKGVCWIIGLGVTIIMAQTKILRKIAEFLVWLIFYKEAAWWRFLIVVAIAGALVLLYVISSAIGKSSENQKKKKLEKEAEAHMKNIVKLGEKMNESVKE